MGLALSWFVTEWWIIAKASWLAGKSHQWKKRRKKTKVSVGQVHGAATGFSFLYGTMHCVINRKASQWWLAVFSVRIACLPFIIICASRECMSFALNELLHYSCQKVQVLTCNYGSYSSDSESHLKFNN